jgi:hypothetical protein
MKIKSLMNEHQMTKRVTNTVSNSNIALLNEHKSQKAKLDLFEKKIREIFPGLGPCGCEHESDFSKAG